MKNVSFSQLALFARCGEAWRRQYLLGQKPLPNLATVAGTAIHAAVPVWEEQQYPELGELARLELRNLDTKGLRYFGKQDRDWWLAEGLQNLCDNYEAHRQVENALGFRWWKDDPKASSEHRLEVQPWLHLPKMIAYVDQVYRDGAGHLVIRDIKTGEQKPEHRLQIQLYWYAWNLVHPEARADYGTLLYLKGKEPKPEVVIPTVTERGLLDLLEGFVQSVEAGVFPPFGVFTDACRVCDFRNHCAPAQVLNEDNILL